MRKGRIGREFYVDKLAMNSAFTSAVKSLTKNGTSYKGIRGGKLKENFYDFSETSHTFKDTVQMNDSE